MSNIFIKRHDSQCACDSSDLIVLFSAAGVKSYHYLEKSYSEYKIASRKKRAISWQDKYKTLYLVQVRTKTDGIIVYESTSPPSHPQAEYSILEVKRLYMVK